MPTPVARLIYGPVDEAGYEREVPLDLISDGIAEINFQNPNSRFWRLFLLFRAAPGEDDERDYAVMVRDDGLVEFGYQDESGDINDLWDSSSPHVNAERNGRNKLRVEFKGGDGKLWINDVWITDLNLSHWRGAGWIFVFAFNDDGDDAVPETKFDDLRIWSFGEPQSLIPMPIVVPTITITTFATPIAVPTIAPLVAPTPIPTLVPAQF